MTPCNPRLKRTVRLSLKVSRAKKGKNYWLDLIGAPSSPVPAWLVCLGSFLLATNCSFLLTMLHSQLLLYSCHTGPIWTFKNVLTIHMICIFESVLGFLRMYLYLPLKKYWHRKECIARFQIPIEFFCLPPKTLHWLLLIGDQGPFVSPNQKLNGTWPGKIIVSKTWN